MPKLINPAFFAAIRAQAHHMHALAGLEPLLQELHAHHLNQARKLGVPLEMREWHAQMVNKLDQYLNEQT